MEPAKEKKLDEAFEGFIRRAFQQLPLDGIENFVHENIVGFGTTAGEEVYSAKEFIDYIKLQRDQGEDLDFNFEREPIHKLVLDEEDLALFAEQLQSTIKSPDGEELQISFLMSTVLTWSGNNWKVIHWHGSIPSDTENDVWLVNEWKAEKVRLEKKVAEQTEDLQQKNRELEIEAATERVRAQAMSMQKPEDILKVLHVVKEEVDRFDLGQISTWLWTLNDDQRVSHWELADHLLSQDLKTLSASFDPYSNKISRAFMDKMGSDYFSFHYPDEALIDYLNNVAELIDVSTAEPEAAKSFREAIKAGKITEIWQACSTFNEGLIGLMFISEPPVESRPVLIKISEAFGMAYQRFRELQQAEQRRKEAELEASVERVRAHAMGMHKPGDIMNVLQVIKEEVDKFELGNVGTWFWIFNENNTVTQWDISETRMDGSLNNVNITIDLNNSESLRTHQPIWKDTDYYTMCWKGDDLQKLTNEIKELDPESGKMFQEAIDSGKMTTYWQACAPFSKGVLGLDYAAEPPEEAEQVLKKISSAFDMTYQRFEDLQEAEQRAYEAKVEAGLERVRSQAAAMNHSDDLKQIAESMFRELEILDIDPLRYGLGLIRNKKLEAELWASTVNDGHYLDQVGIISLSWHPMLMDAHKAWESQHEELVYELSGIELVEYYRKVTEMNPHIQDVERLTDPNSGIVQFCSFLPFEQGVLYAFTHSRPSIEGLSVLKRFAHVFEQAYTRFEDLQVQERQARLIREERDRLQKTLSELRSTQEQLVQQEKLASLGQLTAGIAHEIKNPLNFVNNFSDLSIELVDEVREEIVRAYGDTRQQDIDDILDDIEANLRKINEHGTRADSIVKSMLQHSRGGTGKMEPTAINELIKEFVNLAFHGMRASKDSFNVDIDLQLDESIGEIPLIAEDFSRVILNLVNNAFDALREKAKVKSEKAEEYKPKLSVKTSKLDNDVSIEIEDNGPGITDEMKDKVLQPFFTTKKGNQGTGLGLSITNDIIKAHGGKIEIISKIGQSTSFRVYLTKMG